MVLTRRQKALLKKKINEGILLSETGIRLPITKGNRKGDVGGSILGGATTLSDSYQHNNKVISGKAGKSKASGPSGGTPRGASNRVDTIVDASSKGGTPRGASNRVDTIVDVSPSGGTPNGVSSETGSGFTDEDDGDEDCDESGSEAVIIEDRLLKIEELIDSAYDVDRIDYDIIKNLSDSEFEKAITDLEKICCKNKAKTPSVFRTLLSDTLSINEKAEILERIHTYCVLDKFSPEQVTEKEAINKLVTKYTSRSKEKNVIKIEKKFEKILNGDTESLKNKIMFLNTSDQNKIVMLRKFKEFEKMRKDSTDSQDYRKWLEYLTSIPFGKTSRIECESIEDKQDYITYARRKMDEQVSFMDNIKEEIIHHVAISIKNRSSNLIRPISLQGVPGIGKTLIVESIAEALNRPYAKISLGGVRHACVIKGSSGVWKGSEPGGILDILRNKGVMNPVIHFDELDKVSKNNEEISGVLTHLIDPTQSKSFNDEYFPGINFDISEVLFVFTYNNENDINGIVSDRIQKFVIDPPSVQQKIIIAKRHMIPDIIKRLNISSGDIEFSDDIIKKIIQKSKIVEKGCRQLKRNIETIVMRINTILETSVETRKSLRLSFEWNENIKLPLIVTSEMVEKLFYESFENGDKIETMYI